MGSMDINHWLRASKQFMALHDRVPAMASERSVLCDLPPPLLAVVVALPAPKLPHVMFDTSIQ